jgi:hypothetical protein
MHVYGCWIPCYDPSADVLFCLYSVLVLMSWKVYIGRERVRGTCKHSSQSRSSLRWLVCFNSATLHVVNRQNSKQSCKTWSQAKTAERWRCCWTQPDSPCLALGHSVCIAHSVLRRTYFRHQKEGPSLGSQSRKRVHASRFSESNVC